MPTTTRREGEIRRGGIFIPSDVFTPKVKIQITDVDGVVQTVCDATESADPPTTNYLIRGRVSRSVTALSDFSLRLDNNLGNFLDKFDGGELVQIWADYSDATNLIFRGKVDNVRYGMTSDGWFCDIEGRDYPELNDRSVILKLVSPDSVWTGITKLITAYYPTITVQYYENSAWTTGPTEDFKDVTVNYQNQKAWGVIQDLCRRGVLGCYLHYDSAWYLRVFPEGGVDNTVEQIVAGQNLLSCPGVGFNNDNVINRITVYGKSESENIITVKTEDDEESQTNLWVKERIINDNNLDSQWAVNDKASHELTDSKTLLFEGRMNAVGLPTLKPGESLNMFVPYCKVNGKYIVEGFTHNLGGFTTSVTIRKKQKRISQFLKDIINKEEASRAYTNLNRMKDGISIFFSESTSLCNHAGTQETAAGKLKIVDGALSGNMISVPFTMDYDVTTCEFRYFGNYPQTSADKFYIATDGGASFERIYPGVLHTLVNQGRDIVLKMELTTEGGTKNPAYESVCLLVKGDTL